MKNIILLLGVMFLSACTIVGPTERGVRYNFGSVSDSVLEPGTHLWLPYFAGSKIVEVDVKQIDIKASSGTIDQQEVQTLVSLNVQVDATKVVPLIKAFGDESAAFDRIISPVKEAINANVSKYTAKEVLTKRTELKTNIQKILGEELGKYGINVLNVSITDMQYSAEYSKAIEQAQIAEQRAKQSEYETQRVEQEAKAAIAKAKGEAEANRMKQATITPLLVQLEAVQKWSGNFPQVMGSSQMPFMMNFGPVKQ